MNVIVLLIGLVAIYFMFIKNKDDEDDDDDDDKTSQQKDAENRQLLREGTSAKQQAEIIRQLLIKAKTPANLRTQIVCVPKYNKPSHNSGRSPWYAENPANCKKPRDVKGFIVQGVNGDVFFAFTGDYYTFNFNRIVDEDPDVAYFVTSPGIGLRCGFNFRTGKFLRSEEFRVKTRIAPSNLKPNYGKITLGKEIDSPMREKQKFLSRNVWPSV